MRSKFERGRARTRRGVAGVPAGVGPSALDPLQQARHTPHARTPSLPPPSPRRADAPVPGLRRRGRRRRAPPRARMPGLAWGSRELRQSVAGDSPNLTSLPVPLPLPQSRGGSASRRRQCARLAAQEEMTQRAVRSPPKSASPGRRWRQLSAGPQDEGGPRAAGGSQIRATSLGGPCPAGASAEAAAAAEAAAQWHQQ